MLTESKDNIKEAILSNLKNISNTAGSVSGVRNEAASALAQLDVPTSKNEEWKYTDFSKALKKKFDFSRLGATAQASINIEQYKFKGLEADYFVFVNGKFDQGLSTISSNPKLQISNLKEAESQGNSVFKENFSKHANYNKDFFTALSTAYFDEGVFVKVSDGSVIERPLVFLFISDSTEGNTLAQPRNLIYIGKNSDATIVENFISLGSNPQFTNIISEIVVCENASGNYYKIQNESEQTYHVGTTQVYQEKSSRFSSTTITTNGGIVRNNLNIKLDGEGIDTHMYGLYLLDGNTHVDNHTAVDHAKPHSYSNELYKGVMNGKSTGVFNGKIFVRQDAQKTNAFQSNRNVLLSDDASIFTKPQLEIWADDVKCSHGATTGQIDEEALFYLQSRGISKEKAKALLMIAFASEIVEVIKIKEIKEYVEHIIHDMLH
jgi:Fe-S cluster assembly protein SufD